MREDFIDIYDYFIKKWGIESQSRMCIEEMSELTKELCKLERYKDTDKETKIVENIKEELADTLNMVEQLIYYYGTDEIEKIRTDKLNKLMSKLKKSD
ncbi:MAG: hypothetical protein ACI4PF_02665 [Christensenellales bacterium]